MDGHVRPSTGQTEQTEYPHRHARQVEYLTGPGNERRARRARARSTGGAKRALTIAAGALAAALAGGGIVFVAMNTTGASDTPVSEPVRSAPAGDTGAAEDAPPADGKSPADEAESASGTDGDAGGAEYADGDDGTWTGSDADDSPASAGRSDSRGNGTSDGDGKAKSGGTGKKQNSGEEEETYKNWPFDGPVGYVHPQGPS